MDQNNPLIRSYFSFGQFDQYRVKPLSRRSRQIINGLIKLVIFISAVKLFVVVACTWKPLKLYLIETYVFDERQQRVLDFGLDIVHIGHLITYSYWSDLNQNVGQLKCFNFLFFSNFDELCKYYQRHYNLDRKSAELFVSKYRLFTSILQPIIVSYACFLPGCVLRCSYKSYQVVSLDYFLTFVIVLTMVTSAAYVLVVVFAITKYVLVYVSAEFLMLRFRAISRMIYSHFMRSIKNPFICPKNPVKFKKPNSGTAKILYALNDLARQFKEINTVLDHSASEMILGVYLGFLGLPYFLVFTQNPLEVRLLTTFIAVLSSLLFSSISYYNDRLQREIKALESTIYHVQPFFRGTRTKTAFNNFLLLNNPHQAGISLTFLGLRYSTYSILQYLLESFSLVLLLYQLNKL